MPNRLLGVRLHTNACSGLSRVRTELLPLHVIPFLAPHPVQTNRQTPELTPPTLLEIAMSRQQVPLVCVAMAGSQARKLQIELGFLMPVTCRRL
jgi:hypothetical protein